MDSLPLSDVLDGTPRKPSDFFGPRVRHYRNQRGWKQSDLCDALAERFNIKLDPATLTRLENGQRRVTIDEACLFAIALSVPLGLMLWPIDEAEPINIAPGAAAVPWDAFRWMVGNHGILIEKEDQAAWNRARRPIIWYSNLVRRVRAALRLKAEEPEGDGISTDYLEQLRRLDDAMEQMKASGYPIEGEGWTLVTSELIQDLKRFEGRLDEYRNRFQIWGDDEEV